jgi:glycosyl transferase family 2
MGGTKGGAASRWGRALAFPLVQVARERRSPLRNRYAISRSGLDLRPMAERRAPSAGSPIGLARRLVGAPDRRGPIWAVTMARNEEVRLGAAVRCLVEGGVDVVVVADNLSTDGTRDVLSDLARELPVVVLSDNEPAYYQGPKMSLMARRAARHGASWIVPFDADELWLGVDGTLAERLRSIDGDAAIAPLYDFIPDPEQGSISDPVGQLTRRRVDAETHKIAFRAHLMGTLSSGNHWVMQPARRVEGALTIRHYPFLGFEHFVEKARSGAAAVDRTDFPDNIAEHWRVWAAEADAELRERWLTICGQELVDDPLPDGLLGTPAAR